jgi:exodeoxyribonuclease VII large subunit
MRLEDLTDRLAGRCREKLRREKERLNWQRHRLLVNAPIHQVKHLDQALKRAHTALTASVNRRVERENMRVEELYSRLKALNPMAVLNRGYSITQTVPGAEIVRNAEDVAIGQALDVRVAKGVIRCRVEERSDSDDKTNV